MAVLLTLESFLLCCVFGLALLTWTWQPRSPERSLRMSGSTLTLLLPAVSRAYKQAEGCVCVCVTLKLPSVVSSSGSQLIAHKQLWSLPVCTQKYTPFT